MPAQSPPSRVRNLTKTYGMDQARVVALDDVSLDIYAGQFTAVMGPSGSGKSTLMHCCAGLDTGDSGSVFIGEQDLTTLDDKALTRLRRDGIGFVFQSFNLVPTLTARGEHPAAARHRRPQAGPGVVRRGDRDREPRRPARPQAQRALRRPAAAGRDRPRPGQPAADRVRRRADRQPRLPLRRRGARAAAQQRRRAPPDRRDGDPRPGRRRLHRPGGLPRRRPDRRGAARARPARTSSSDGPARRARRPH